MRRLSPSSRASVNAADLLIEPFNDHNRVANLYQVRLAGDASGGGTLYSCTFNITAIGYTGIWVPDMWFFTSGGHRVSGDYSFDNYWISDPPSTDVNGDGVVNLADVLAIALHIGTDTEEYDVDRNGWVNIGDMIYVIQRFGTAPSSPSALSDMTLPEGLTPSMVKQWIDLAQEADDGSDQFRQGIAIFTRLLEMLSPQETRLLANYPNPFNPETWIPYRLAMPSKVKLTIYDTQGKVVRRFDLGRQESGNYTGKGKAIYWDGRNRFGEQVGSGIYFYHLQAGDYSSSRRLVILK